MADISRKSNPRRLQRGSSNEIHVRGICQDMCPKSETVLRVREKLFHKLELDDQGKPTYLVKEFRRSAAGQDLAKPEELRTPSTCFKTAKYLIEKILQKHEFNLMVYDFITDRLRSIRQDLIIQGNPDVTISRNILEISTKFHLYANYKLASQPTPEQGFNKDSNFKQLLECLKTWLSFTNTDELDAKEAIGIYLMLNLGSKESIKWGISLKTKDSLVIKDSIKHNLSYIQKNFIRIFQDLHKLPLMLQLATHWTFPHLISCLLTVMSCGFSAKNCLYPLDHFMKLTLMSNEETARQIFQDHNIEIVTANDGKDYIRFYKGTFKSSTSTKICHYRIKCIDEALADTNDLSQIFLAGKE